jgi:succinoglycan biosynthesis protein ExoA
LSTREAPAPAPARDSAEIRRISVVAPMWNEARHIEQLVADLAAQDFDGEVELIVADGRSSDASVELLHAAAKRHDLDLRVLDNPARWVSAGLNACIREATGDLIVRIDCHSGYPPDYLRQCATVAKETGADNVGGIFVPRGGTHVERAVGTAMDSPFGGIHWTRHGAGGRHDVDTVPYGAFRPRAFELAGLFDESLVRNQDDEFNFRLRRAGGRIVLDPSIRIFYTPRSSLRRLFRQYFEYGLWKPAVMRKHGSVVSVRSLAPILFLASLAGLALLAPFSRIALLLFVLELSVYLVGALVFGLLALRAKHESVRLLPRVLASFATFHLAYGIGMAAGLFRARRGATPASGAAGG